MVFWATQQDASLKKKKRHCMKLVRKARIREKKWKRKRKAQKEQEKTRKKDNIRFRRRCGDRIREHPWLGGWSG